MQQRAPRWVWVVAPSQTRVASPQSEHRRGVRAQILPARSESQAQLEASEASLVSGTHTHKARGGACTGGQLRGGGELGHVKGYGGGEKCVEVEVEGGGGR